MKANRLLAVLLAGLLHAAPVLRTVVSMEVRAWAPSSWAWICQVGAGAIALLGSYDAVSGATQIVGPYTVNATVGTAYSRQLTTSGQTAHSWSASTAPLGSAVFPLTPGLWLTNSNGRIGGIPAAAAISNITISAWQNSGNTGAKVSSVFTFTVTNSTPTATPPTITTQPKSQTNYLGSSVTFTVAASGTAPLSYQWRFQGSPIANATSTSYTISSVQSAHAGNYSVVVTNAGGSVTSANAALTVLPLTADLIAVASGPTTVSPGASLSCVVSVTNLGPTVASNVVVSDSLPLNAIFVSATGGGTANAGVVTWPTIASLAVGQSASFTVTMTAPSDGSLTNTVSASSAATDPNAANNNGSAQASRLITTVAPQADVAAGVSGPASVNAGASYSYQILVTNLGPSVASNVSVSDTLPPGVTFISASGGGAAAGGVVTWPMVPSLARDQVVSLMLTVRAPGAGPLTNRVSSTSATPDPVAANNNGNSPAAVVTTAVQPVADLAVLASGPAASLAGGTISYSITVSNLGPSASSNIFVSDLLPSSASFVSATAGGSFNGGIVSWPTIGSLAAGGAATFGLTVTAPAFGSLTNRASSTSSTPDPNSANNNGSDEISVVTTEIGQLADVAVLVSGPASVLPGSNLTYTIIVTNLGPTVATNVIASDVLPVGATFVSSSGGVLPVAGVITWPAIGSLAPAGSASFSVTVASPTSGTLTNIASATSGTPDPNAANNNGTAAASRWVVSVGQQADLAVLCSGPSTVPAGASFSYIVIVTNRGPSAASDVVLRDTLPPTASFVSATGGGAAAAGVVTWPAIATLGQFGSASFTLTVTAPGNGTLSNFASSTSPTYDPVPANHDGTAPASRVLTTVQPSADLAVIVSGPAAVLPGTSVLYTIGVTNLGPSAASNVVVSDRIPPNASLMSVPGASVANNIATWPAIASLASGASASFTLTVTAPASGTLTNVALASSGTPDPNSANNDGTLSPSRAMTAIATEQFGISPGAILLNPQTGLFEQLASVTNTGPVTIAAFRLYVSGLRTGVQLYNATGTNAGKPFVQFNAALNPAQATTLRLEFFVPDRQPFTDTLSAEAVLPENTATVAGGGVSITRAFVDSHLSGDPRFVIEFPSTPGRVYTIIYSDNLSATWKVATPSITAAATVTQWYDDGPPKTVSSPLSGGSSRLYRVLVNP